MALASRRSVRWRMAAAAFVAMVCLGGVREARAQGAIGIATSITVQQFMQDLANYGTWHASSEWGWVWQPRAVLPGWRPYAQGEWQVAEGFGLYWHSYEAFGWAVYHYGRWAWWDRTGWVWIPDKTWGPGYVNWAYGDGYVAWTPMAPTAPGPQGIRNGECQNPAWQWMVVPQAALLTSNVWQWAIPSARNANILPHLKQSTVFSGVSDYSIPKDMLLAIAANADPAQPVMFVMTPLGVARGDQRGVIAAYAPVLTGAAPPLANQFHIVAPPPPHAPPPPSRPAPPLPPTWRPVAPTHGATEAQAEARARQLQSIYQHGAAQRLALAQSFDPYAPPVSAWNMSNAEGWSQNESAEQGAENERQRALTEGGAYGGSPYAPPQQPQR